MPLKLNTSKNVFGSISKPFRTGEFEWSINICSEILDNNDYLNSPTFSFSDCSWYFSIYPKGYDFYSNDWISIFLGMTNSQSEKNMSISLVITFQDKEYVTPIDNYTFKKYEEVRGYYDGPRKDILHRLSTETEGRLCIKIRLTQNVPSKEDKLLEVKKQDLLCQNYKDLLLHDKEHDLILKVKNKEFKVHQNIMQFRCPVFKLMLSHDMLERNRGVVEIPDCDPLAFEQFLFYIYTGNLETLDESVMLSLYYIADKYDMGYLKEMCCKFIKGSLSAHNLCEVIRLASIHSDSSLLESANAYFLENAKEVLLTTEWLSFMKENHILANKLIRKMISYKPQPQIMNSFEVGQKSKTAPINPILNFFLIFFYFLICFFLIGYGYLIWYMVYEYGLK